MKKMEKQSQARGFSAPPRRRPCADPGLTGRLAVLPIGVDDRNQGQKIRVKRDQRMWEIFRQQCNATNKPIASQQNGKLALKARSHFAFC